MPSLAYAASSTSGSFSPHLLYPPALCSPLMRSHSQSQHAALILLFFAYNPSMAIHCTEDQDQTPWPIGFCAICSPSVSPTSLDALHQLYSLGCKLSLPPFSLQCSVHSHLMALAPPSAWKLLCPLLSCISFRL